jgi:hypothetical protein
MIQICDYLIELGHRKFALITGINTYLTSRERMIGCNYSFSKNQIDSPYIASCDWEPDSAYRIAKELLSTADPMPTAIIGFNDNIAIGCLRAASELGLRVPEDISIVGFDDIEQSRYAIPAITTVHSGIKELAQATINGLLFQIANPNFNIPMRCYVPCSLVIRESTAKLQKNPEMTRTPNDTLETLLLNVRISIRHDRIGKLAKSFPQLGVTVAEETSYPSSNGESTDSCRFSKAEDLRSKKSIWLQT